jgi:hypothetical protein
MENDNRKHKNIEEKADEMQRRAFLMSNGVDPAKPTNLSELIPENDTLRSIPNNFARSSLFTAKSSREPRATMMNKQLFHCGDNVVITFSGIELRSYDDELVWMQIITYAKSVSLGNSFDVSLTDLLRDIGWPRNGSYYEKARDCIIRLRANVIIVQNISAFGKSGTMSLIQDFTSVNDNLGKPNQYRMTIHPNLICLFAGNTFTSHKWAVYRELSPIARRLADYAGSHKTPYPLDIEAFRKMCDSNNANMRSWKTRVISACREVQTNGIVISATVEKDKIIFNKT